MATLFAYEEVQHLRSTIAEMSETLTHLQEERDLIKSRYETLNIKCSNISRAIDDLQDELELSARGSTGVDQAAAIDLEGCTTMGERLRKIAIAMGGQIHSGEALDI